MAVTNQKYLQISFAIDDGDGGIDFLTLPIKPEELTRSEPSRVSVVNSLDGAWIDAFGRGLATLTISGHTGWGSNNRKPGDYQFELLRDQFIHAWHLLRRKRIDDGKDPNDVRLIFIDALNGNYVADVVPMVFVLRRSKSQPLLFLYNITMTVVKETAENPYPELLEPIVPATDVQNSLDLIQSSVDMMPDLLRQVSGFLGGIGPLGSAALTLIQGTVLPAIARAMDVMTLVSTLGLTLDQGGKDAIALAGSLSQTATTSLMVLTALHGLPIGSQAPLMQLKSTLARITNTLKVGLA
jgi:hypothetical protein